MENISDAKKQEIQYIFNILDVTGSGYLTATELSRMMRVFGYDNSVEDIQRLINEVDTDGTGLIDFNKFCAALYWTPNPEDLAVSDSVEQVQNQEPNQEDDAPTGTN